MNIEINTFLLINGELNEITFIELPKYDKSISKQGTVD